MKFVKFHIKQGLVLLGISVIIFVLNTSVLPWMLYPLTGLINLGVFVLSIVGIVNVINHKEAALPLVGDLAKKITI